MIRHGFQSLCLIAALLAGAPARADITEVLKTYLTLGLGWRVCPNQDPPPSLEKAFDCDGMEPDLVRTEILLKKHDGPNGFPYWMGEYEESLTVRGIPLKAHLIVTFGTAGGTPENPGKKMYFIEGELISGKPRNRLLFQTTAENGFATLPTTLYWGQGVALKAPFDGLDLMPVFYVLAADQ